MTSASRRIWCRIVSLLCTKKCVIYNVRQISSKMHDVQILLYPVLFLQYPFIQFLSTIISISVFYYYEISMIPVLLCISMSIRYWRFIVCIVPVETLRLFIKFSFKILILLSERLQFFWIPQLQPSYNAKQSFFWTRRRQGN